MTNKDVFKVLLCSYGYDRNIKIETYYGDEGFIGYNIHGENKDGDVYDEVNCEGFMFQIYHLLNFMKENNSSFKSEYWSLPPKYAHDDILRNERITQWDKDKIELQKSIDRTRPLGDWRNENNPCTTCQINKKDYWDNIHYNCELCYNNSCKILRDFESEYEKFRQQFNKKLDRKIKLENIIYER